MLGVSITTIWRGNYNKALYNKYTSMVTQQIMVTPTMIQTYTQVPSREQLLAPIVEEAKKEGKLVIYSTLDRPSAEPLLNAFRSKYSFINI